MTTVVLFLFPFLGVKFVALVLAVEAPSSAVASVDVFDAAAEYDEVGPPAGIHRPH
jgi:hypothetical protein